MTTLGLVFLTVNAILLLLLPRRWAPLPLLVGTCYMTLGQVIEIGPFHFTVIRILVAAGLVRILVRGERLAEVNAMDWLMTAWAVWALVSSAFHRDPTEALIFRFGLVYNACGIYLLLRVFNRSADDALVLCRITLFVLLPLALEMVYENVTHRNLFSIMGGVWEMPSVRAGRVRAQGPFAHAILAGTVGSVCLPFAAVLWRKYRAEALLGIGGCSLIILASASSGPILSAMAALGALFLWNFRRFTGLIRLLAVAGYIGLDLLMRDPAYYILARINLVGGSTGWHRARLIQSSIERLSEWWVAGTDYTRHWMPSGVTWSPDHTDITNHYIKMGVIGGLPLMLLFMAILLKAFSYAGSIARERTDLPVDSRIMLWALGSSLFAHAATFLSVSYFDQSMVFLYLTLATIGSAWTALSRTAARSPEPAGVRSWQRYPVVERMS